MKKIFLTSLLICSMLSLIFFSSINANAAGDMNNEISNEKLSYEYGDYDNYTNSDFLVSKYSGFTIHDYESRLWHTTVSHSLSLIINEDDPIIEIIPKDFFRYRGSYLYIGYDYAFFINTKENTDSSNLCEIMIIDINQSYDLESPSNPSQVVQTVKPIFQAEYLFLGSSFDYSKSIVDNLKCENKSSKSSVVVPLPKNNRPDFKQINKFYLTNVGFQACLANSQHLNQTDSGYKATDDNGSFFTRSDMYFNGVGRKDYSKYLAIAKSLVGMINIKGVSVGNVIGAIDILVASMEIAQSDNLRIEQSYGECYKQIAYTSKNEQIKNYGYLLKAFSNTLTYEKDAPVLFGTHSGDQYVTNKFTINKTSDWRTLINAAISFKIVDDGMREIVSSKGYYQEELRSIEYKSISNETVTSGYHLSNMKDYFQFSSEETSYYSFSINNSSKVLVSDVNNNPISNINGFYKIVKGQKYIIEVQSVGEEGVFNLSIRMITNAQINLISLLGQEEVYIKYIPSLDDLYCLSTPVSTSMKLFDSNENLIEYFVSNPEVQKQVRKKTI
ncbi:MAG: hypothetical protein K2J85_05305, partial [Anaeroplasmataceae bacterium]|nr:hypothetical protein [Anaeroplasmataceae bacterium]